MKVFVEAKGRRRAQNFSKWLYCLALQRGGVWELRIVCTLSQDQLLTHESLSTFLTEN